MNRRVFLALTCGAAVWPVAARAQQRVARIGVLLFGRVARPQQLVLASELARLGYVEHRNIAYEISQCRRRTRPSAVAGSRACGDKA